MGRKGKENRTSADNSTKHVKGSIAGSCVSENDMNLSNVRTYLNKKLERKTEEVYDFITQEIERGFDEKYNFLLEQIFNTPSDLTPFEKKRKAEHEVLLKQRTTEAKAEEINKKLHESKKNESQIIAIKLFTNSLYKVRSILCNRLRIVRKRTISLQNENEKKTKEHVFSLCSTIVKNLVNISVQKKNIFKFFINQKLSEAGKFDILTFINSYNERYQQNFKENDVETKPKYSASVIQFLTPISRYILTNSFRLRIASRLRPKGFTQNMILLLSLDTLSTSSRLEMFDNENERENAVAASGEGPKNLNISLVFYFTKAQKEKLEQFSKVSKKFQLIQLRDKEDLTSIICDNRDLIKLSNLSKRQDYKFFLSNVYLELNANPEKVIQYFFLRLACKSIKNSFKLITSAHSKLSLQEKVLTKADLTSSIEKIQFDEEYCNQTLGVEEEVSNVFNLFTINEETICFKQFHAYFNDISINKRLSLVLEFERNMSRSIIGILICKKLRIQDTLLINLEIQKCQELIRRFYNSTTYIFCLPFEITISNLNNEKYGDFLAQQYLKYKSFVNKISEDFRVLESAGLSCRFIFDKKLENMFDNLLFESRKQQTLMFEIELHDLIINFNDQIKTLLMKLYPFSFSPDKGLVSVNMTSEENLDILILLPEELYYDEEKIMRSSRLTADEHSIEEIERYLEIQLDIKMSEFKTNAKTVQRTLIEILISCAKKDNLDILEVDSQLELDVTALKKVITSIDSCLNKTDINFSKPLDEHLQKLKKNKDLPLTLSSSLFVFLAYLQESCADEVDISERLRFVIEEIKPRDEPEPPIPEDTALPAKEYFNIFYYDKTILGLLFSRTTSFFEKISDLEDEFVESQKRFDRELKTLNENVKHKNSILQNEYDNRISMVLEDKIQKLVKGVISVKEMTSTKDKKIEELETERIATSVSTQADIFKFSEKRIKFYLFCYRLKLEVTVLIKLLFIMTDKQANPEIINDYLNKFKCIKTWRLNLTKDKVQNLKPNYILNEDISVSNSELETLDCSRFSKLLFPQFSKIIQSTEAKNCIDGTVLFITKLTDRLEELGNILSICE